MKKIPFQQRLEALLALGEHLQHKEPLKPVFAAACTQNGWFSPTNCATAVENISKMLQKSNLERFVQAYPAATDEQTPAQEVGLVLAGNIPMVGFHDVLCGWLCGHRLFIKLSDKDSVLMRYVIEFLHKQLTASQDFLQIVDKLKTFQKVIATGSDNSSVYFERYFANVPHLIRKNRNSLAILNGQETESDIMELGKDIFRYFGLGCRSVSKIFLPEGYDIQFLMRVLDNYKDICHHTKYVHNYDYNRSIYLLNNERHYLNDCLILLENPSLQSRIATLHYEFYQNLEDLTAKIQAQAEQIQCIAANFPIAGLHTLPFGQTQQPAIDDFADGVDTMQFLLS